MNAGQWTSRRIAPRSNWTAESVCSSCLKRLSLQTRRAATAAAVASPAQDSRSSANVLANPPVTRQAYQIRASVVLSRPPLLTRPLHPFEKAFYLYQRRLNERLALPFTRYFYYKKGTPADAEWKRKAKTRLTPARDIGVYNAYGKEGWNDELLVGDETSEPEAQVEALVRDAEGITTKGGVAEGAGQKKDTRQDISIARPLSRTTEADAKDDQKSLDRRLDQTLYLLVKNKDGRWRFPEDTIRGKEGLHTAAERVLVQAGGIDMNTWVVGNAPVGHHQDDFSETLKIEEKKVELLGEKTFFMKARIMAGQANLEKNLYGDTEFRWLSKAEIESVVTRSYWSSIRNMLVER